MSALIYDESNFMFSNAAWILPTTSGTLSVVSSLLIMSIILRSSPESRFSPYHIIMFFMSFWDGITSTAIALTTIPMPSDVHEVYPFKGKSYGNVGTCDAQGFIIWMGTFLAISTNCCLNAYYLCTIRYEMSEERVKKKILPLMLLFCMLVSIPIPMAALLLDYINPQPLSNFCAGGSFPAGCKVYLDDVTEWNESDNADGNGIDGDQIETPNHIQGIECRGTGNDDLIANFTIAFFGGTFLLLFTTLVVVVKTVFETEVKIRRSRRDRNTNLEAAETDDTGLAGTDSIGGVTGENGDHNVLAVGSNTGPVNIRREQIEFKRTRAVLIQALMYIVAFLLTWGWVIIVVASTQTDIGAPSVASKSILMLNSFFQPLQGFFNAMIFIYSKAHRVRQAHSNLDFCQAVMMVIIAPSSIPEIVVSRIDIVYEDSRQEFIRAYRENHQDEQGGMRRLGTHMELRDNIVVASINSNAIPNSSLDLSNQSSLEDVSIPNNMSCGASSVKEECREDDNASTSSSLIQVPRGTFDNEGLSLSIDNSVNSNSNSSRHTPAIPTNVF